MLRALSWLFLLMFLSLLKSCQAETAVEDKNVPPSASRSVSETHVVANIGETCELVCSVEYPGGTWAEHVVKWRRQGVEVPFFIQFHGYPPHVAPAYAGRVSLLQQASIQISDVHSSDHGWYQCSVVFVDGLDDTNTNGTWVHLSVNSPPVLGDVSPSFLVHKRGDTVDMFCEVSGTPTPTLTWLKDEVELTSSERVAITGNRVQLKGVEREDGGVYSCLFVNKIGRVSHIIKLVIDGNAYIMVAPRNTTVQAGARARLACQAEGLPSNITYHWLRRRSRGTRWRQVQLSGGELGERTVSIHSDGSLLFASVLKTDSGWYKCRPTNGFGKPPEAMAFLNVTYLPLVLSMPAQLFLARGMLGRVECPVDANPPATLIVWSKNERALDFGGGRLKVAADGSLIIRSVSESDAGRYTCTPFSSLGTGSSSSPMQVIVKDPPFFSLRPQPVYQRMLGESITLPCIAEGDPPASIFWRKVDGLLPKSPQLVQDGGNLTVAALRSEDGGHYACIARNIVASIITNTQLIIETKTPHEAYNLTVQAGYTSALLSWMPAYDGGSPQHYVIWFSEEGGNSEHPEWQTVGVQPRGVTEVTIHQLKPATTYQFTVQSRNGLGMALFSNVVVSQTRELESSTSSQSGSTVSGAGPAPVPPYNVTARLGEDGLLITWMPARQPTMPETYYIVYFRTVGPWVPLTGRILASEKPSYLWKTMSQGATYHFQVYAFSRHDARSEPSVPITFSTPDPRLQQASWSSGTIGGVVAAILLFLSALIFVLVCSTVVSRRRREREGKAQYENVKYFGPKTADASKRNGMREHSSGDGHSEHYLENDLNLDDTSDSHHVKETPI